MNRREVHICNRPTEQWLVEAHQAEAAANPDVADLIERGLDPYVAKQVRRGPGDPHALVQYLTSMDPEFVREALSDPRNLGIYEDDEAARQNLMVKAAWLCELESFNQVPMELDHHFVVRDYGNKVRVCHWNDRGRLVVQSVGDFHNAHREKFATYYDGAKGVWKRA